MNKFIDLTIESNLRPVKSNARDDTRVPESEFVEPPYSWSSRIGSVIIPWEL